MGHHVLGQFRDLVIISAWFLVSESHSDISTINRLHKFPPRTYSFIVIYPYDTRWAVLFSGSSCSSRFTIFSFSGISSHQSHFWIGYLQSALLSYHKVRAPLLQYRRPLWITPSTVTTLNFFYFPFFLKPWFPPRGLSRVCFCCLIVPPFWDVVIPNFMLKIQH